MRFEFATATRIIFGSGTLTQAGPLAKEIGSRALVVTGSNPDRAKPLLDLLKLHGVEYETFPVPGEPSLETVRNGLALAKKERLDLVIGFGGGSALDAGKAIAIMLTNDGDVLDYLEVIGAGKILSKASAPYVAIPTTAGTGSEVTRNAVLSSPEHRFKASLRSPYMLPAVAIVDPQLTCNLPPAVTANTGMDALTQLIEPYVCNKANPLTDALCIEGIKRIARSFEAAYRDGQDLKAREDMALASLFGGLALSNAGLGAGHGLAGPIGGMFDAPHGAICAALLPHVMAANIVAMLSRDSKNPALGRYKEIACVLTGRNESEAENGVDWVISLTKIVGIQKLGAYGVSPLQIPDIVEKSRKASSMKANPVQLTDIELCEIVAAEI